MRQNRPQDYFFEALLVELSKQIIRSNIYFPTDEFKDKIAQATKPPIPDSLIDAVFLMLVRAEFATEIEDDVAGSFTKLHYAPIAQIVAQRISEKEGFIFRYSEVGPPLLERVASKLFEDLPETSEQLPTTTDPLEEVPASDRVVTRSDNQTKIVEIETDIAEVRRTLREDNEIGADLGDDREIIDLELEVADEVLKRPRFRLKSLLNWLLPALSFLAEKFAGGAIGEAAKRLVSLLLSLI